MNASHRPDVPGLVISLILFAFAGLIWWDTTNVQIASAYGPGPTAMPYIVGAGMLLIAVGNLVLALRGDFPARDSLDWKPILLILGGMAVLIALISYGGGLIPATGILFAAVSAAFGRRAFVTDLIIGLVLGLLIYVLFSKLLALSLPMGPIERLI
ncbi:MULTISPECIES: tripartite tricarboxylate transporter TctB family protein [Microvirga]|uniref:tripartite tricarboxylate transporter TctB family protein n=1 Tax=Microvirga TaxID=186650 RepID=UPI001CFF5971|nr:tripartite tricarboxylate transporter TctB family protein [Microvirga lenta]MCB5176213.1 tripartite tricarboxylate transporter TctB family protein [Microvirga lenta]